MPDFSPLAWRQGTGRFLRLCLPAFLAAVLLLSSGPAPAQDTIVVGRSGMPEVEINLDAIEFLEGRMGESVSFGTFQSKGLLMPGSKIAPGERIVLIPPGSQPKAKAFKLKRPRSSKAGSGVSKLKLNIPETTSAKPAMPKPPKAKPSTPAKAKQPAPTEMAATPPEAPPQMDMKPEPAAKAEPKKVKATEKPVPEPKKEAKEEPQLAAKAEKKAMPEPPAAPPPAPKAKETAMKAPEKEKPAPDMTATNEGGLTPPPLPDLPDLPTPPPAVSLKLPPPPEKIAEETAAAPPPPPPVKEQAKSEDAAEPVPMSEPVLPQPRDAAAPEEPKQVAALPPPSAKIPATEPMTVLFSPESAVLDDEASGRVNAVREKMKSDQSLRLQLVAYATSTDDNPSRARRLSLSRALAVRFYLVEKGVKSTRMDVRALGSKFEEAPGDRVDLVLLP